MSVPHYEKLEFRVLFIGEDDIGKKSLLTRFRNLKCSETIEFPNPPTLKTKKNEKLRGKPCDKAEIPIEVPLIKQKIDNLANFTKIFRIEKNYFEFNFFLVPAAEKVGFSDNLNEDDEVEKLHKMKFLNVKTYLQSVLQKPIKPDLSVRYILLFMFDITEQETYDRMKVYFDEINKILNFDKNLLRNYFPVVLANKIDLKFPYEVIDRNILNEFIEQRNVKLFETSGKLYFNFEKFFQKFFFDLFENEFPAFVNLHFKERFNDMISLVKTIPTKPREFFDSEVNDVPGPQKYKTNIYDIWEDPDFKIAYNREKRFNNKIFINKKGPVFDFKKDDFISRKNEKTEASPKKAPNSKSSAALLEEELRKKKIKEMNAQNNAGYSFGLKHSLESDFKELRRQQNLNIKRSLENIFDLDNITIERSPVPKRKQRSNSAKSKRELVLEKRQTSKLTRIAKREKKQMRVKNKLENLSIEKEKKNEAIKAKYQFETLNKGGKGRVTAENYSDEEYDENNPMLEESYMSEHGAEEDRKQRFLYERYNIEGHKKRNMSKKRIDPEITPGPANYDTRGDISLKKHFTFKGRPVIRTIPLSSLAPKDTVVIKSDIDEYAEKPKFAEVKAQRFKSDKIYIPPYPEEIYKKMDEMTMRKYEKIRENIMIMQQMNSKRVEKPIEETPGPNYYEPNYNQVDNNGFAYSIRDKLEKQNIYGNEQDESSKVYGLEQSVTYLSKNITRTLNPLPDYSIGKTNAPMFSIPRSDRFGIEKGYDIPAPDNYFRESRSLLKENQLYNMNQGTSIRFKEFEYSPIPGPGNYKVEGFADDLLKKNANLVRYRESLSNDSKKISIEKIKSIEIIDENQNEYEN